jgi:hypothetical protein
MGVYPFRKRANSSAKLRLLSLLAAGLSVAGCGGDRLDLAKATGRVTLRDAPVPFGIVTFVPEGAHGGSGPTGSAHLNSDGTFSIETLGREGALVGHHRVRVNLYLRDPADQIQDAAIPERYMHETTSGLTAHVTTGGVNEFQFALQP